MKLRLFSFFLLLAWFLMCWLPSQTDSTFMPSSGCHLSSWVQIQQQRAFVPAFLAKVLRFTLIGPAEVKYLSLNQSQWVDCDVLIDLPDLIFTPLLGVGVGGEGWSYEDWEWVTRAANHWYPLDFTQWHKWMLTGVQRSHFLTSK